MKLKNTLLLLVLALGLFAFIRFYESKQLGSREKRERAGRVVMVDRDQVDSIVIKNSESKIEFRKDAQGVWKITDPVKDRADSMTLSQLFTSLESLKAEETISSGSKGADKDQLKEFGLFNSETKLKLGGKGESVELVFGKDTAVEGKVYVKVDDSNTAYVIGKDLKEQISRKVDEFRDRKLTALNTAQVTKVSIKTSAGEIDLERKDEHWSIVKPLKARGDDSKIGDLVSLAAAGRIERFLGDSANAASYGLQEPRAVVSMWPEGKEPTVLSIGESPKDEKDRDKSYAKVSSRDGVVLLPKSVEVFLTTKPNDLRDKNLLRVEMDIVDRINIEGGSGEKVVLARKGESWVRKTGKEDAEINLSAARRLLEMLRSQQVDDFVADVASDLQKYGLDQPQVKLTLSSYASENTAETRAGEKPIAVVLFGKAEEGKVYARLEDEPFIVSVPERVLDVLMTDPRQWQPLEIYTLKTDDITAVEVTRAGQGAVSLERDADKKWKLAKGDGTVDQINAQSLVNTLATLRAVRWIGAESPEREAAEPTLTISFKAAETAGEKLTVFAAKPDESPRGVAAGRNGTFELNQPDLSAFQLPLVEKAPAQPPLTPAPAPAAPTPAPPAQ